MAQKLAGKVAVVTGGGNGIGREIVLAMTGEGAKIVVNDISKEADGTTSADKVVAEVEKANGSAVANYDSVATMTGGENIVEAAVNNFGRIDILVNCAGNFITKPTVDMTEQDWDAIMDVHLKGLFGCTQPALKEMIKQQSGRIINITSVAAYPPGLGPGPAIGYCTAKAGVLGFTRMLALEMKENGITVNAISPDAITQLFPDHEVFGAKRYGPEYIPPIIVFLATDEAKNITGQVISSGGGEICVFAPPLNVSLAHKNLHKMGKWTVDELIQIIPPLITE